MEYINITIAFYITLICFLLCADIPTSKQKNIT